MGLAMRIRSMNDICRRGIAREMLAPEFCAGATGWIGDGGVGWRRCGRRWAKT
jgi:hypothetical protein